MTEFLQSIKSDLLSRRLLPLLALFGVALIAAVAYAVMAGSSGSASAPVASSPSTPVVVGPAVPQVSVAPVDPNEAVSETPGGVVYQSHGPTRDPFIPLPSPVASTSTSSSPSKSSSTGSSSSGASSSGGTGPSTGGSGSGSGAQKAPAPTPPKKPAKPQFPYIVSVLFGPASTIPGQPATLTPYQSLKLLQPLPSRQDVRISFERVTADSKGAVFKLVIPPILHGSGICLPSTSECQMIDLEVGHTEELEYIEATGQVVVYELRVVSIVRKDATADAARAGHNAKLEQTLGKARAAQAIGKPSALQVSVDSSAARAKGN